MYSEVIFSLLFYLHLASLDESATFLDHAQGICRSIKGKNHNLNLPLYPVAACSTSNLSPAQVQGKAIGTPDGKLGSRFGRGRRQGYEFSLLNFIMAERTNHWPRGRTAHNRRGQLL